ncbi:MAG: hypothetical protein AAF585_08405 [Verrucomicrobiota bacterium]
MTESLEHGKMARGAIQVGSVALPFGPIVVGGSPEWAFDADRINELKQTSAVSGGQELVELGEAWKRPEVREYSSIQLWLLIFLLAAILMDVLITRMGWQIPLFDTFTQKFAQKRAKSKYAKRQNVRQRMPSVLDQGGVAATGEPEAKPAAAEQAAQKQEQSAAPVAQESGETRRSRFARAKKRR